MDPERLVEQRVREALAPREPQPRIYAKVRWVGPARPGAAGRNGESDVVVVDPERGWLLAIEVKGGLVGRDGLGRWYAGERHLAESPFEQAETGARVLARTIEEEPAWVGSSPRAVHAVAFPSVDASSVGRGHGGLGPDAPIALILDRADLATAAATSTALDRIEAFWSGDGSRDRPFTPEQVQLIDDVLACQVALRPLLAGDIEAGERELVSPTAHQLTLLRTLRTARRASIVGSAGSGKTLLAAEKARQLATDGYNTLLVCFNQPLAKALADDPALQPLEASGRLTVSTFHELCRRLGAQAGVLPSEPANPKPQVWWDDVLPRALLDASSASDGRWQAIVVDEGQDFAADWLETLDLLTSDPGKDVFYLFHDPAQAIFRPDATDRLGLTEYELPDNCRNARPIHELAFRFYRGSLAPVPLREDGRSPEVVVAEPGPATLEALRDVLHRLVVDERVARDKITVLSGASLEHSAVWRQRRFKGGLELWNGSVDAEGRSLGLAADASPRQPPGTIRCETIRRFKGLEADVVVLVELPPDDDRLDLLLYIGVSRAKHHVVLIVPPAVARRL